MRRSDGVAGPDRRVRKEHEQQRTNGTRPAPPQVGDASRSGFAFGNFAGNFWVFIYDTNQSTRVYELHRPGNLVTEPLGGPRRAPLPLAPRARADAPRGTVALYSPSVMRESRGITKPAEFLHTGQAISCKRCSTESKSMEGVPSALLSGIV